MSNVKDCSTCKYCNEDFVFDEETGEEYPFYTCTKGNDTDLDYKCKDFKEYKPRKYREKDTKCDKCKYLQECIDEGKVIDCRNIEDTRSHYIKGLGSYVKCDGVEV